MANTIKAFSFEIDIHGAKVIAAKSFIGNACLSNAEVDGVIAALKADLDALAPKMKAAIKLQAEQPLELK